MVGQLKDLQPIDLLGDKFFMKPLDQEGRVHPGILLVCSVGAW